MDYRIAGAMLNSALYLTGVFALGLVSNTVWPCRLAIAAAGATYLSYLAQTMVKPGNASMLADGLVIASIIIGAAAGLTLLF